MQIKFLKRKMPSKVAITGSLLLLAACGGGGGALLATTGLFGPTVQASFARGATEAPLTSAQIQQLTVDRAVSFTTDPIDL